MQKIGGKIKFSPSDLITFMDSKFDSWMDRWSVEYPGEVLPDPADDSHALLQKLGNKHEEYFLQKLKLECQDIVEIAVGSSELAQVETLKAMREGHQVIYQGVLSRDCFAGRTDFLYKVDGVSSLGNYHYEVWDTKLAKKSKPYFVIQLCCYAEMLETIQGVLPKSVSIVLGDLSQKTYLTSDYIFHYRQLKESFLQFHDLFLKENPPEDALPGTFSKWKTIGQKLLKDRDDLSQIANIRKIQIQRLKSAGIQTITHLVDSTLSTVPKMNKEIFDTLKGQARLQVKTVQEENTAYEFLPRVAHKGFYLLPPANLGDVYFDMEGYPHVEGGLEYLFGATYKADGKMLFKDWWAHDRIQEKVAFDSFIDWIYERWRQFPEMHVYHYASYEVSAARRLAGRHATKIKEVDDLLRHEIFVDLYQIVRQGLLVGEPSYSIKNIEHLYREKRAGSVSKATDSVVYYEKWLESPDGKDWQTSPILSSIRDYNEEDCVSTLQLADWLRGVRNDILYDKSLIRTDLADDADQDSIQLHSSAAVLANDLFAEAAQMSGEPEKRVKELLAGLLEFHAREEKPGWWEYFDRRKSSPEELYEDPDCLSNLKRTETASYSVRKSFAYEYSFDADQDTKIQVGDKCKFLFDARTTVYVESIDKANGKLVIVLGPTVEPPSANECIVLHDLISAKSLAQSILKTVIHWRNEGTLSGALGDLIYRRPPKIKNVIQGSPIVNSSSLDEIIQAILNMDHTTLCIQGPPGCGKTYTASHAIVALLKQGKRVGITSNSHKAIENLLQVTANECAMAGLNIKAAKIAGNKPPEGTAYLQYSVEYMKDTSTFWRKDDSQYNLIGGTAWFFSDDNSEGLLDYLFVDEAGQVCLANIVAMSRSTRNIVLIGDQMQLEQPIKGSHPGETGQSSLEYLLQEHPTVQNNLGIFLGITHRMHPALCKLISDAIYESRLSYDPANERQILIHHNNVSVNSEPDAGLVWVPVKHFGNAQASEEEVETIANLVESLCKCSYVDKKGNEHRVELERDIIIVTPYNMQVRLLTESIPGAQVASIDKFQGREAPIVILSMCASEGSSSPRGSEFLFSKSRLNVALSRARTIAFVVGSTELVKTKCSTLTQMHLLNLFCQIVQTGSQRRPAEKQIACVST